VKWSPVVVRQPYLDGDLLGTAVDVYDSAVASTDDGLVLQDHNLQVSVNITAETRHSMDSCCRLTAEGFSLPIILTLSPIL